MKIFGTNENAHFSLKTAYGQLIALVFIPICILAGVGALLVLNESTRAAQAEQQARAQAILARYQPVARLLTAILDNENGRLKAKQILQVMLIEEHLQRAAIIDIEGRERVKIGIGSQGWPDFEKTRQFLSGLDAHNGTVYGLRTGLTADGPVWLMVEMDNQPLEIAQYRVWLALSITGLFTILLLLISLNFYSRRWIAPIYEMRLHLQRTNANNLYMPMSVESSGELNLLQQELVKTLRRLHSSFQELQDYADQTEADLSQAFDEMEMQNISIRNSRDAAISASQAKSAFLANISHELRTPLNSIDGFINLLARKADFSHEQNLYVQTIRKSSAHLLALVNDVLDFSKIEEGKLILDAHDYDLYSIIYEVMDMLSPVAAEKTLKLAIFFYDDVPTALVGDALRIKQVLTNLVSNAIKFTEEGEVVVRVQLDEKHGNRLHISVQDTGKGINKEHQKQLFQSFSQGDPSVTRQYGGTGLGLVISKQLTRLMGGHIGFYDNATENIANKGSTFWFSLPIVQQQSSQAQQLNATPWVEQHRLEPQSLLVWFNHKASLQLLQALLTPLGINITKANSLVELLEILKQDSDSWDWVIVDSDAQSDVTALLKQVRAYFSGDLAVFGYQVMLDNDVLSHYGANMLYQPIDRRQLFTLLSKQTNPEQTTPEKQWQGVHVLAVDDHMPNLLVLEALLAELGIQVTSVNSGYDAIETVSHFQAIHKPIDLIFMDIQMPRMSGLEATEQIRKIEAKNNTIPIIALTAHALSDERDNMLAAGIDDYVSKPINQGQLLQMLQKWLTTQPNQKTQQHEQQQAQFHQTKQPDAGNNTSQGNKQATVPQQQTQTNIPPTNQQAVVEQNFNLTKQTVINWEDGLARAAGKPDLAAELLIMLLDSLAQEKQALTKAWQAKEVQTLAHISHRILGATRYSGAPQLRFYSEHFENQCLIHIKHKSRYDFNQLQPSYTDLMQAIDNLANADLTPWPQLNYHRLKESDMNWKMI